MAKNATLLIALLGLMACSNTRHVEQKTSTEMEPPCGLEALDLSRVAKASDTDTSLRVDVEIALNDVIVSNPSIITSSGQPFSVEFQTEGKRRKDPPACFRMDLVPQLIGQDVHLGGGAQLSSTEGPSTFSMDKKVALGASMVEHFELEGKQYTLSIKPSTN